jgi:hypothetical protein
MSFASSKQKTSQKEQSTVDQTQTDDSTESLLSNALQRIFSQSSNTGTTTGTSTGTTTGTSAETSTGTTTGSTMGTTTGSTTGTSTGMTTGTTTRDPYAASKPMLEQFLAGISGLQGATGPTAGQSAAISELTANAGNPYADKIGELAGTTLDFQGQSGMAKDAYTELDNRLRSTANGENLNFDNNPFIQDMLKRVSDDVALRTNAQFAAAGRDLSGYNSKAMAEGVTSAQLPILANLYNQEQARTDEAARTLYGAGAETAGRVQSLDSDALGVRSGGVELADAYTAARDAGATDRFNLETMLANIPYENMAKIGSMLLPTAGVGGSSSSVGTETGTQTGSTLGTTTGTSTGTTTGTTTGTQTGTQVGSTSGTQTGQTTTSGTTQNDQSSTGTTKGTSTGTTNSVGTATGKTSGSKFGIGITDIGKILTGLGSLSDERAKEDVKEIGALADGQPIHSFRYKGDPETRIGVIAQEVEQKHPEAVVEGPDGLKRVDLDAATRHAAEIIKRKLATRRAGRGNSA